MWASTVRWEMTRPAAARTVTDAEIVDRLRALRTGGHGGRAVPEIVYGRRKMTDWLNRQLAADGRPPVSRHTVDRLMRTQGMRGLVRGRGVRTTVAAKADARRAGDLLNRRFSAAAQSINHPTPAHRHVLVGWRGWVFRLGWWPGWSSLKVRGAASG